MLSLGPLLWATDAARIDPRSLLVACLLVTFVFFLAYLSNPSEASFRSYLTEQSFRQHLSRLDDPARDKDSNKDADDCSPNSIEQGGSAVHFSSRAAVALRTPKHVFHSFALFTIAAVLPNPPKGPHNLSSVHHAVETKEAWFIGAFGRWWKGGYMDPSWPAPAQRKSKGSDDDAWSSGIMTVKALDKHDGLPLPASSATRNAPRTPPKLRSRDRERSRPPRTGHTTPRNSTPPPLPKSVTLPLHTPRHSQTLTVPTPVPHPTSAASQSQQSAQNQQPPPVLLTAKEKEAEFGATPPAAELLARVKTAEANNAELRTQISEHASQAKAGEGALGAELAKAREDKRAEDTARAEAKGRTKALEEAKRAAEAQRRDAERRLLGARKVIEDARSGVETRQGEIRVFEAQERRDREMAVSVEVEGKKEAEELAKKIRKAHQEAKIAEEVVAALGTRARELEEDIEAEIKRLEVAREHARLVQLERPRGWLDLQAQNQLVHAQEDDEDDLTHDVFPTPLEKDSDARSRTSGSGSHSRSSGSGSREVSASPGPRPSSLNLRGISNLGQGAVPDRGKGYAIFDDNLVGLGLQHPSTLTGNSMGLGAIDIPQGQGREQAIDLSSPTVAALIPDSLIRSLERDPVDMSASFTSDSDAILERDWKPLASSAIGAPVSGSGNVLNAATEFGQRQMSHGSSISSMHSLQSRTGSLHSHRSGSLNSHSAHSLFPVGNSSSPAFAPSAGFSLASASSTNSAYGSTPLTATFSSPPSSTTYASTLASSPVSAQAFPASTASVDELDGDFNPFEVTSRTRIRSDPARVNTGYDSRRPSLDAQRVPWTPPRTPVDEPLAPEHKRRWWPAGKTAADKEKDRAEKDAAREVKRGLNPDAKVFRFGRKPATVPAPAMTMAHSQSQSALPFDSLNPSGFPSPPRTGGVGAGKGSFLSSLSLRAFAPSPAEREALQRALGGGGSKNASLERLPSLGLVSNNASLERLVQDDAAVYEAPGKITFSPWAEGEAE